MSKGILNRDIFVCYWSRYKVFQEAPSYVQVTEGTSFFHLGVLKCWNLNKNAFHCFLMQKKAASDVYKRQVLYMGSTLQWGRNTQVTLVGHRAIGMIERAKTHKNVSCLLYTSPSPRD